RTHSGQELLGGRHPQAKAQGPVAVVKVEPVVGRPEHAGCSDQHGFVAGARDLKEDPVLALKLNLPVVDASGEQHKTVELDEVGLLQLRGDPAAGGTS